MGTGGPSPSGELLRVHFIDVGQGDSILIESPNKHYMLIDGGTKSAGKEVVEYLRDQEIRKLDYVVATHPDADHIGGLIPVLNSISIKKFIDSGKVHTSETYEEMLTLIQSKNIPFEVAHRNDNFLLDDNIKISVLHADEEAIDNNEASIVLKVVYDEVSFLLTADAGVEVEKKMMESMDVRATILKAGHHGSNTSSSLPFVQAVKPEATILSYGQDNTYGHPHYEVIQNLQHVGSKMYGTAESGTIVVATDGKQYEVLANEWTGIGGRSSIAPPERKASKVKSKRESSIIIESVELEDEVVAITNNGEQAISMNGWQLLSVEGNQLFNFPDISIAAGDTLYITSGPHAKEGKDYIKWTGRQVWLNDGDTAQLINPKGEVVNEH
ncbi:MBL fold metallo-hydrolase [Lysinibacillus yapensis]|uniref:MBL fold metallo-hydrolase n=2 Tax=Ureibacillus yapensis TaxID=2304605 RepID=A0A396S8L6_9BACL|nr:MBL fold metallo-hydrolase [Lysinibacillus yapensis]